MLYGSILDRNCQFWLVQLSICGAMTQNHGDEHMHDTWLSSFDMERKIDEAAPIRTACSINRSSNLKMVVSIKGLLCLIFITSSLQEMIKSLGRVEVGCKKQRRCRGRAFQKVNQETTEADFWALPGSIAIQLLQGPNLRPRADQWE